MRDLEDILKDDRLTFNIGDILIHINGDKTSLCEILSVKGNTALVRFESEVIARYVNISDLYNP